MYAQTPKTAPSFSGACAPSSQPLCLYFRVTACVVHPSASDAALWHRPARANKPRAISRFHSCWGREFPVPQSMLRRLEERYMVGRGQSS
jgi:hypothetical protein